MAKDTSGSRETELKLTLLPDQGERLRRHPLIRSLKQGRARGRHQVSTYYDTPARRLWKAGIGLRVRQEGKSLTQTVKAEGEGAAGLFSRPEWNWPVDSEAPDVGLLKALPSGLLPLKPKTLARSLEPVFVTDIKRTTWRLAGDGWAIELAHDAGEVRAGEVREPISELELELLEGSTDQLFTVALELAATIAMRPEARDKAQRGHNLAAGITPQPTKNKNAGLTAEMTVEQGFAHIARTCLAQITGNGELLKQTGDIEALHQLRVGTRRLRSAIDTFKATVGTPETAEVKSLTGDLGRAFGDARDLDVFVTELLPPLFTDLEDSPGGQAFLRAVDKRRQAAYKAAYAALDGPDYTRTVLRIAHWIEAGDWRAATPPPVGDETGRKLAKDERRDLLQAPLPTRAVQVLEKRYKAVRKAGRDFDKLTLADLHNLRVRIKKLRYAVEFFSELWDDKNLKRFIKDLKGLQDALGHLNDLRFVQDFAADLSGNRGDKAFAWTAGQLAGRAHERVRFERAAAAARWGRFIARQPYWR